LVQNRAAPPSPCGFQSTNTKSLLHLGLADCIGTVEVGTIADLVVVREDPLVDVEHAMEAPNAGSVSLMTRAQYLWGLSSGVLVLGISGAFWWGLGLGPFATTTPVA